MSLAAALPFSRTGSCVEDDAMFSRLTWLLRSCFDEVDRDLLLPRDLASPVFSSRDEGLNSSAAIAAAPATPARPATAARARLWFPSAALWDSRSLPTAPGCPRSACV